MLDGFEAIPASSAGGSFNGSPWRVVLHTTEGGSVDGAVGAYRATGSWPHFTVDPAHARRVQHYDLNVSARALLHRPGDPETNRANAIQIEIVGFAAESPDWPKAWLQWLGAAVLTPIRAVCPFVLTAPLFVRYPDSYGFGASQRATWDAWAKYSGIVGHEHVPGNDHGDPGALDVTTIIAAIGGAPIPQPATEVVMQCIVSNQHKVPPDKDTLIFQLRDNGIVYVKNVLEANYSNLPGIDPALKVGKPLDVSATFEPDGALQVSCETESGAVVVAGRPPGKATFDRWVNVGGSK